MLLRARGGTRVAVAVAMRIANVIAIALIAPLAACTEPSDPTPATTDITEDVTNTPCATLPADYILYVPETFYSQTIPSGNGSYGYIRNGTPSTCAGYIVDVLMATYSSLNPYMGMPTSPGRLIVSADSYDLPGSTVVNGRIPTTKEDCTRLSSILYAYTWPHTDIGYTYVGGWIREGAWANGVCTMPIVSSYGTIPQPRDSTSGWDKYRFVINSLERTTYQEAAVFLNQPGPG